MPNLKAYRLSVNLKLGLILFAVCIAVASLAYTNALVDRLRDREQAVIQLWARAQEQVATSSQAVNPYLPEFEAMLRGVGAIEEASGAGASDEAERQRLREALLWARTMPPPGEVTLAGEILLSRESFGIPAIWTDSSLTSFFSVVNVRDAGGADELSERDRAARTEALREEARRMATVYEPIPIELGSGPEKIMQYIYYDESQLVKELRLFPYVQLLFVGLFVLVGYLGFSYVRRSEQSSLWVGMAKEAAHQLGTPISSLMGWTELLKSGDLPAEQQQTAVDEIEKDIDRLRRVANRFSDIGSMPKLEVLPIAPVIEATADYMRRRLPHGRKRVALDVSVPPDLEAPINPELFDWVIENLLKNALDAIETQEGRIDVEARSLDGRVVIDVRDTGKGIDRRQWKNVFRPGYSTKKRGWGLGLSLSKRIVEDYHGGTIALEQSRIGQGSTFRITLPASAPARRSAAARQHEVGAA